MRSITNVHESILPFVEAAISEGFTVHLSRLDRRASGVAWVSHPDHPGTMTIQRPTHPWEGAQLSAPVFPNREHGSGVLVDYDGTTSDALRAIWVVVRKGTITTRFVPRPREVPTDNRLPRYAVEEL